MPLRVEEIKLAGTKFDGRAKLSEEQRQAILPQIGLKSGVDFQVTNSNLKIKHYCKKVIGTIATTLKEVFPVFNFYWQTSRILVWF